VLSSTKPNAINFPGYAIAIMKLQIPVIACLLAALPAAALADSHNDHTSYSRPSAPARSSQPARTSQQAAPRYSQQAAPRYSQQAAPRYSQQAAPRYSQQAAPRYSQQAAPRYSQQAAPRYTQPMPRYQARTNYAPRTYAYGGSGYVGRRNVDPWYWNRGQAWVASPGYWGGGFWGAFSVGLAFNNAGYYSVQADSPGSQLLANYGLQQTDCNQPNLVDILGPDGSEICAYPNNEVGAGQYQVDPSTLSLVSG
jgi:hypothetical protein